MSVAFWISAVFLAIVGAVVVWAVLMTVRNVRRWRRVLRKAEQTIVSVRREQGWLSEGLVPEFAVEGDRAELMRRYCDGEDIPLRWRVPE